MNTLTKDVYDRIRSSVSTWPQWKKDLANTELLVSKKSKKI